jgi:NADH dehydrogenase FAD-containing subunit
MVHTGLIKESPSLLKRSSREQVIDLKTNCKVVKVSDKDITMTNSATGEISVPYGMAVWSTGIGTRPIIMDFMKEVGQVYHIISI